jgi:hypothetical protein
MNDGLMDAAYKTARENYKSAAGATFEALSQRFITADFDTVHSAAQRGMRLHIAAIDLAQKIWAKALSYEKAEGILGQQFSDFPPATRQKALSDAYVDTR